MGAFGAMEQNRFHGMGTQRDWVSEAVLREDDLSVAVVLISGQVQLANLWIAYSTSPKMNEPMLH